MIVNRRKLMKIGAAGAAGTLFAPAVLRAQSTYPNRPLQFVVPFDPGGGADRTARLFAPYLAERLGQPVNVVNIAGGGGWVAWQQFARWDANDDDHIMGTLNFPHVFSFLDPRMRRTETLDSFNILAWHSLDPCVWCVRQDEDRFTDLASMIEYIRANPGELVFSTTGVGSDDHMGIAFAERFVEGFEVRKIYSNGDSAKLQEVMGGVSDVVAANVGYMTSFVNNGTLRWSTVLHDERYELIPDVPTFNEVTGQMNVSFAGRTIAVAPGLAEEKAQILLAAIEDALSDPEYIAAEAADNNNLLFMTGDEMDARIASTLEYVESVRFWEADT